MAASRDEHEAGVSSRLWSLEDIIKLLDADASIIDNAA
jgi:hypothetical protein